MKETSHHVTDLQEKLRRLEQLLGGPVLIEDWPRKAQPISLPESLRLAGQADRESDLRKSLDGMRASFDMLSRPIIAVLGQLNAGKSSVVASFLSPAGRTRVPRGCGAAQGTHRFVYWVPQSWFQDETAKKNLRDLLAAAHGRQWQDLSHDPEVAAEQYRSGRDRFDLMEIPLVACDPALDEVGAALLDCPDVQTRDGAAGTGMANARLNFVCSAATICSAFLLTWDRSQIRDQLLEDLLRNLRERMEHAPLYFLINRIRSELGQPAVTRDDPDVQRLIETFHPNGCYGAFDFDMEKRRDQPGWRELTPPELVARFQSADPLPQFFSLSATDAISNPIQPAESEARFLVNLPRQLDPASLQRQKCDDNWTDLKKLVRNSLKVIEEWREQKCREANETHIGLLKYCLDNVFKDAHTGEPWQILTAEFTDAFQESWLRTAPRIVRWSSWLSLPFKKAIGVVKARIGDARFWIQRWRDPVAAAKELASRIRSDAKIDQFNVENAETLAQRMRPLRWVPIQLDEAILTRTWQNILTEFRSMPAPQDSNKLDQITSLIWRDATAWQKTKVAMDGLLTVLGSLAAVVGLLTAVVDGGATLFASYSLAGTLAAQVPGLAALVVAAAGGAMTQFQIGIMNVNTLPYLARFFDLACDNFGVPRDIGAERPEIEFGRGHVERFRLPVSGIAEATPAERSFDLRLFTFEPAFTDLVRLVEDV